MYDFSDKFNKIILASESPRRRSLLAGAGIPFEAISLNANEDFPADLATESVAPYLSQIKANSYNHLEQGELLITCDTTVCLDNEVINKPENAEKAVEMLLKLSGRKHTVITGVTLTTVSKQLTFSEKSEVFFEKLTLKEIEYYVNNFSPFDKAGAYGIQDWIGYIGVKRIEGCYYNIMGLPVSALFKRLIEW